MMYINTPKILRTLGIDKNLVMLICNNPLFYHKFRELKNIQKGGNYKISIPEYNDEIIIEEYLIENKKAYSIFTKKYINGKWEDEKNPSSCLIMLKDENIMHIETINSFDECVSLKGRKLNGSILLNIAIKFIESIKDIENINQISLIDKAVKLCGNTSINLSDFKILISGNSWYGDDKYGFIPAKNKNGKYYIDENKVIKYNNNKKIIQKLTVRKSKIIDIIINNIKLEKNIKYNDNLNKLLNYMKINIDKKLSVVLSEYLTFEKFRKRCFVINLIIDEIFRENNLQSFSDMLFIKNF